MEEICFDWFRGIDWVLTANISQVVIAAASLLAAMLAIFTSWATARSLERSMLMTVVELERDIGERAARIADLTTGCGGNIDSADVDAVDAAIRSYYNAIDRLAYCMLEGWVSEKKLKLDYLDVVREALERNSELFGKESRFRNIKRLGRRWIPGLVEGVERDQASTQPHSSSGAGQVQNGPVPTEAAETVVSNPEELPESGEWPADVDELREGK